ncbi:MAG: phosphatase PAP2 family protein [Elusimicrobiaceae bacterium]|jgi:undecaprenyl-diphosphatase
MLYGIDTSILYFFNVTLNCAALDYFMRAVTLLGVSFFALPLGLVLLFMPKRRYRIAGLVLLAAFAAGQLVSIGLKDLFARPRPPLALDWVRGYDVPKSFSFPSGHSINAFLMAFVLAWSFRKLRWAFYTAAALVGLSRLYLGAHYPSDVLCGAALGLAVGWAVVWAATRALGFDRPKIVHHGKPRYNRSRRNSQRYSKPVPSGGQPRQGNG